MTVEADTRRYLRVVDSGLIFKIIQNASLHRLHMPFAPRHQERTKNAAIPPNKCHHEQGPYSKVVLSLTMNDEKVAKEYRDRGMSLFGRNKVANNSSLFAGTPCVFTNIVGSGGTNSRALFVSRLSPNLGFYFYTQQMRYSYCSHINFYQY